MRLFVAIDLPEGLRGDLDQLQSAFRSRLNTGSPKNAGRIRWTQPAAIHLTLKFLGETPQPEPVMAALSRVSRFPPFAVRVQGFGFYPDARRARIFWAGVTAPDDLFELARHVEDALVEIGVPREARRFSPHLTLARISGGGSSAALEALARESAARAVGEFEVRQFFLFESKLSAGAPAQYRKLAAFPQA